MNDKEISIELLKLYPQYEHEYTFEQFLNLFNAIRKFIPNRKNTVTHITKDILKSFQGSFKEDISQAVIIEFDRFTEH
ncbi:hypothetical protein [Chryseobacterium sediminis]|uniref:Uncharacterized protein n=1 Tax=Chryseobacterium sediminis TaxID=1679494 RepID=A0A5B2U8M8_9FLAO|nr:hypothetical protein [Chryseobacterium sediminis]KAA2222991.1 hypothetical protein FW780_01965 [Chryseobacterium sediminis]